MKQIPIPAPYTSAEFTARDVLALRALATGTASEEQQKRALAWVINSAALTYDLDYRPDSRDHAFASGRRFVGLQIVKLVNMDLKE